MKFSTGLRNYMAVTGSLRAAIASCVMKIYAGTEPATADAALSGATLLCTITKNGDGTSALTWEATANDGTLIKMAADAWSGTNVAGGTRSFFRLETLADGGTLSTTAVRAQGSIKLAGGDMNMTSLTSIDDDPTVINNGAIAIPAQ